jgi:hypothetical protein
LTRGFVAAEAENAVLRTIATESAIFVLVNIIVSLDLVGCCCPDGSCISDEIQMTLFVDE